MLFLFALSALAAPLVPAPEDLALVAPLLIDKIDLVPERIVYVVPPGSPDGDGSFANPRSDLIAVVTEATAGTAIHLAPGRYDMSQIRDDFGYADSALFTANDGESGRPIVIRTDPDLYDPDNGAIAVLDFNYENDPSWRRSAFIARNDYWVFERFEMTRMASRGFWVDVGAHENVFRELDLHHANFPGSNNEALILMAASAGPVNNVIIGNHLHDAGVIDTATDQLLERGSVNGGCFYSEVRLTYDSTAPTAGSDATRAEWEAGLQPADGGVYLVANRVNDCHYGLANKTHSRGPIYFLSNQIRDVDLGIQAPWSSNVIRNNVVKGNIQLGRAGSNSDEATFFKMTGNGNFSEVSYNTVVGGSLMFFGGWSSTVQNNLVIDSDEPIEIRRNQFPWWENGAWPGIRGEFLLGDLDATHPFYDLVPGYMKETPGEFLKMDLSGNCYTSEPAIGSADFVQAEFDVTGQIFDVNYTVLSASERSGLFVDEAAGDYERVLDGFDCGARVGSDLPAQGTGDTGVTPGQPDDDTGQPGESAQSDSSKGGCGCRQSGGAIPWVVLPFLVLGLRRKRGLT